MTTTLLDTRNSRSPRSLSPASVADRIAHFETMQHKPVSNTPTQPMLAPIKKELADGKRLELFLEAIGEVPPALTSPKLRRIATEWWQTVHLNKEKQQRDDTHMSLSSTHSLMEAALDPKCANLEVQALEELIVLERAIAPKLAVSPWRSLPPPLLDMPPMDPLVFSVDAKTLLEDAPPDENQPRHRKQVTFQIDKVQSPHFLRTPFTYRIEEEEDEGDCAPVILTSPRNDMFYYR
jgi:hypothetical protein